MRRCSLVGLIACACLLIPSIVRGEDQPAHGAARAWTKKVHRQVLESASDGLAEFTIVLEEQADLSPTASLGTKQERGAFVVGALREVATRSQAPLIEMLQAHSAEYRPYRIVNMIWVRGEIDLVATLAQRADVKRLDANLRIAMPQPVDRAARGEWAGASVEWNLERINADQVWALGYDGDGVVVGGADTGYDWALPALREQCSDPANPND